MRRLFHVVHDIAAGDLELVAGDDVAAVGAEAGRALDEHADVAEPERAHDRHLERRRDVLLRPLPDESRRALRHVEPDEDRAEDGQERDRAGPRGDVMQGHACAETHSEDGRAPRA